MLNQRVAPASSGSLIRILGVSFGLAVIVGSTIGIGILSPGKSNGMYHGEDAQEDFLVLSGECLLIVEGQERPLKAWDFVHCPPWTEHIFVGAGDGPCVVLGVGVRRKGRGIVYPVNETASEHGAGVAEETSDPRVAYSRFSEDTPVSGHDVFPG